MALQEEKRRVATASMTVRDRPGLPGRFLSKPAACSDWGTALPVLSTQGQDCGEAGCHGEVCSAQKGVNEVQYREGDRRGGGKAQRKNIS